MKHLYEKYPPKNTAHTAGDTSDDNLNKTVINTIMHYHSDKQVMLLLLLTFTMFTPLRVLRHDMVTTS
jgi:hypothetical protein